jgi:hypothetical protein
MPSRYICDVLDEMRSCDKTKNYSYLPGLIEEAQVLANRMEAALDERRNYMRWHERCKSEKEEYTKLVNENNKLRVKLGKPKQKGQQYD